MAVKKRISRTPATLIFQAPEFPYYQKGAGWFGILIIIASLVVIDLIFAQKYFLTLIFVVGLVVFLKFSFEKPKMTEVKMDSRGVKYKGRFYPWKTFVSFGLLSQPGGAGRIYLDTPSWFSWPITIEHSRASQIKPLILQNFLRKYLPERFIKRSGIFDSINRFLRF